MIGEYQIAETVGKLNYMERQMQGLLGHVRLLRGVHENIEARALLETANQLCLAGMELEEHLRCLVGEGESAARRFPPPRSAEYDKLFSDPLLKLKGNEDIALEHESDHGGLDRGCYNSDARRGIEVRF